MKRGDYQCSSMSGQGYTRHRKQGEGSTQEVSKGNLGSQKAVGEDKEALEARPIGSRRRRRPSGS